MLKLTSLEKDREYRVWKGELLHTNFSPLGDDDIERACIPLNLPELEPSYRILRSPLVSLSGEYCKALILPSSSPVRNRGMLLGASWHLNFRVNEIADRYSI